MKYNSVKVAILSIFFFSLSGSLIAQCYWQQRVAYQMDIDFDVKADRFSGKQHLKYYNQSPDTLYNVYFHLYFNAFQPNSMMDVRSRTIADPDRRVGDRIFALKDDEIGYHEIHTLKQDGKDLSYIIEGTVMEVKLQDPILPGTSTEFYMEFESQVPVQIRRSGRDNKEGIEYSMAQWYPKMAEYDEMGWHTHPYVGREFYAPWGDFDVKITIDKKYILAGTGTLQNASEIGYGYQEEGTTADRPGGKTLTWHFKAEKVHDFVWTADPDYVHTQTSYPGGPVLHFFYQKGEKTKEWEKLPDYTARAFQYIEKHFGEYPYTHYSVIQGGDGGMEYPMATLITGHRSLQSLVGVTVHEALHSWYQGLLATNESYYAWMDEGFTSYAEGHTMYHLFPPEVEPQVEPREIPNPLHTAYQGYIKWTETGLEEPMNTHADHFNTNAAYGRASYTKGAVSLQQLGYIIGRKNLEEGLRKYYYQWRFKHPDMNDFIRVMEKHSGLELHWYYEYWVNTTHTIDYAIDSVAATRKGASITLKRTGRIPMPVDVWITRTDGSRFIYYAPLGLMRGEKPNETGLERITGRDWHWTDPTYTFELDIPLDSIRKIEIDATTWMADVDRENNVYER